MLLNKNCIGKRFAPWSMKASWFGGQALRAAERITTSADDVFALLRKLARVFYARKDNHKIDRSLNAPVRA